MHGVKIHHKDLIYKIKINIMIKLVLAHIAQNLTMNHNINKNIHQVLHQQLKEIIYFKVKNKIFAKENILKM